VILVNHDYDIQMINSAARYLLGIYRVAVGNDLIHLTQNVSATALRMAIDAAFRLAESAPSPQPEVEYESEDSGYSDTIVTLDTVQGERRHLQIACFPQRSAPSAQYAENPLSLEAKTASSAPVEQVLLVVSDVTRLVRRQQAASAATRRAEADRRQAESRDPGDLEQSYLAKIDEVERLRAQVAAISVNNRALVHANEELAGANLSLRSANDELLVGLEETESSAEEIKTLNEELQATNEELVTVNEELEATVEELHTSNEDLDGRGRELQLSAASLELQRQASEAARAQIEAILLSMGDALLVVDSHGIPTLTNATYARLFGASDALIITEDETGQRLPPNQQLNHLTASGAAFRSQFTLAGPDGTRRWYEAAGEPVRSSGIERGGVVTIRDVTERSLHHLQEEFLLRASHELRSPLTALLTALQLLAKGAQNAQGAAATVDGSPTEQRNDLAEDRHFHQLIDVALRQVRRLRVLTNDLLDVGRLQQSKLDLHLEPVDLAEVVAQAATVAQFEALQNPQSLTKQALILEAEAGSFTVLGDAVRLEQIILNLLTNAMKYAPDAERIEVRLGRWDEQAPVDEGNDVAPRKELPAPRRYAQLQVQDFGPGIAAEDLPHLFTRFFQSTYPNGAVSGGLGLGLYITRELVRAHGGGIFVDSTLGGGTTCTVRFPLLQTPPDR
jgi:two-component system, chemotaxis family, CheB/CheR fusion protein